MACRTSDIDLQCDTAPFVDKLSYNDVQLLLSELHSWGDHYIVKIKKSTYVTRLTVSVKDFEKFRLESVPVIEAKDVFECCILLHRNNGDNFNLNENFVSAAEKYFALHQEQCQVVILKTVDSKHSRRFIGKEDIVSLKCCTHEAQPKQKYVLCACNNNFGPLHNKTANKSCHVLQPRDYNANPKIHKKAKCPAGRSKPGQKNKNTHAIRKPSRLSTVRRRHDWLMKDNCRNISELQLPAQTGPPSAGDIAVLKKVRELTLPPDSSLDATTFYQTIYLYPVRKGRSRRPRQRRQQVGAEQSAENQGQDDATNNPQPGTTSEGLRGNIPVTSILADGQLEEEELKYPTQESEEGRSIESASGIQFPFTIGRTEDAIRRPLVLERPRVPTTPRYPKYADAAARRQSLENWPAKERQKTDEVITSGFFFTGTEDLVRCYFCGIGLKEWDTPEDALFEHIRHSPDCPFLLQLLGGNLLDAYKVNLLPGKTQSQVARTNLGPNSMDTSAGATVIRSPQFAETAARLESFHRWPENIIQTPELLSNAGFYYTGFSDVVRCYACDGGLQRWDPQDDPWLEHAKWFPQCHHVRTEKGEDYVELIQQAFHALSGDSEEDEDEDDGGRQRAESPVITDPQLVAQMESLNVTHAPGRTYEELQQERETADPMYKAGAQSVMSIGYSRAAVRMAITVVQEQGKTDFNAGDLLNVLIEKEDRGEQLPVDPDAVPEYLHTGPGHDDEEAAALFHQNRQLRRILKCIICKDRENNVLFIPCTHHCVCDLCALDLSNCPECKAIIKKKIKTYTA